MSKALRFILPITAQHQDCRIRISGHKNFTTKNISITLLQISLKLHEHGSRLFNKLGGKVPVNDFGRTVSRAEKYSCK